jgi:hypothetical protein
MTLPASGPLSLSVINTEFGRGTNLNAYRGTGWYTDAGGSGTFSSGALSISEFYSKRLTSPQFSFTISSNQTNANLRTLAVNAGWNQSSKVIATINSGVYVSSNSTGTPGLTINGSFPGGVELYNNGFIVGMGGAGGGGGGNNANGGAGNAGGGALSVSSGVAIWNYNTIAGGGGGGGGGGFGYGTDGKTLYTFNGCGGGGGRSGAAANSSGGGGRAAGGVGTASAPGAGGVGNPTSGSGNSGGGWGSVGGPGAVGGSATIGGDNQTTYSGRPGGAGGAGGYAVTGNASISWGATGTRLGAIS